MLEANIEYSGSCLCGAINYRVIGPSLFETQCCCRDCQKATGTGHTTIVGLHQSQMILDGTPATYTNTGETGGSVTRHFCAKCGGRLFTTGDYPGEVLMIQAGSLDDPNVVTPQDVIYHCDAVSWDRFAEGLPIFDKYAPFAEVATDAMKGIYEGPAIAR